MTRIALLGAESTGKSTLARDLASHLRSRGLRAVAVPESLRAWCQREGRSPRPEELPAIAQQQEDQADAARADGVQFVVCDTSALMVAISGGLLFEDSELLRFANERQRACDATLVTGLDLPWVPDGQHRNAGHSREEVDALVRSLLQRAGVAFQVVYGSGPQRLQSALIALVSAGALPPGVLERPREHEARRAWTWACEKCSDPECEHRLFTGLREPPA